jgi:hypothetical protein
MYSPDAYFARLDDKSPPLIGVPSQTSSEGGAADDAAAAPVPKPSVPLFGSAPVRLTPDRSTHLEVVEDVAGFAGGSVWWGGAVQVQFTLPVHIL